MQQLQCSIACKVECVVAARQVGMQRDQLFLAAVKLMAFDGAHLLLNVCNIGQATSALVHCHRGSYQCCYAMSTLSKGSSLLLCMHRKCCSSEPPDLLLSSLPLERTILFAACSCLCQHHCLLHAPDMLSVITAVMLSAACR